MLAHQIADDRTVYKWRQSSPFSQSLGDIVGTNMSDNCKKCISPCERHTQITLYELSCGQICATYFMPLWKPINNYQSLMCIQDGTTVICMPNAVMITRKWPKKPLARSWTLFADVRFQKCPHSMSTKNVSLVQDFVSQLPNTYNVVLKVWLAAASDELQYGIKTQ